MQRWIAPAAALALCTAIAIFFLTRSGPAQPPPQREAAPAMAATAASPIVVEIFQSQGCSSCPPANANVNALAGREDVLALSFAVDYWDHLGWRDTFATPQYTQRQRDYARALGHRAPFTPQIVINGRSDLVGQNRVELESAIARASTANRIALRAEEGAVIVSAGAAPASGADILLVRYDPQAREVPIARGENAGRTLPHRFIVRELATLGHWTGEEATLPLPAAHEPNLAGAILLQAPRGGPILGALRL